jgi:tRNA threonylcarbamoyladenosine biosynthesis protein TsaE
MQKISLNSPEDMFAFGQELAASHKIICLQGELGAGKTTLIKGFAAWLGMDHSKVNSPTYTYIQEYSQDSKILRSAQDDSMKKLLHIDMYNIHSFDQLVEKWIAELVHDYAYIAIERPKFLNELGLEGAIISIEKGDGNVREIIMSDEV